MTGRTPSCPRLALLFVVSVLSACTFELADVEHVPAADGGVSDAGAGGTAANPDASIGGSGGVGGTGGTTGEAGPWPHDAAESGPEVGPNDSGPDVPDGAGGMSGSAGAGGAGGTGGPPPIDTILQPATGMSGDGFLASPTLCGQEVWDYYAQSTCKAIHVGRDVPCGTVSTYRAYVQFDLQALGGASIVSAVLRFELRSKTDAQSGVRLVEIEGFGNLDSGDWQIGERHDFGQVLGPSTAVGWIETDVTSRVAAALSQGVVAFKLQYENESEDPQEKSRWYGVTACLCSSPSTPQRSVFGLSGVCSGRPSAPSLAFVVPPDLEWPPHLAKQHGR